MGTYDIICIGSGPTGLACAMEAKRAGMNPLVIDKGCLCNSIYHYPVNMVFFTTPELLEIGDLPLVSAAEKPVRVEALKYYRKAVEHYALEVRLFERVQRVDGHDGHFTVVTQTAKGGEVRHSSKKIAVATGYYDLPNTMGIPGEDLPHVSHYYTEPYEFWNEDVVVIGGKNSAAEAALDLYRNGARVTLVHRKAEMGSTIKYWVRPDIENRIKAGQVKALFETSVKQITPDEVVVQNGGAEKRLPAKQVFALTGYHPDFTFIESLGVQLDPETRKPALDPNSLESNVPGIHLAGVVIGGRHTSEIFIENGRFHGKQIIESLKA
ncbi:MAG TPA: YpdA family putative bacillithiol disulfide reductase [Candidatus Acidoferrum sp.]|jgi:thioredoxin reductase (NADPH)|nr:YpdA family putative bacillithiol disulfide reductase [Candidatus Acidoferrum sp.]